MNRPDRIFRNTVALSLARLAEKAVSICLSFVIARRLGPSALGVYSAAIVFYGLISIATDMGSATFAAREIGKDRSTAGQYLPHLGAINLAVAVMVMAAAWLLIPHLGYSGDLLASAYVVALAAIPGSIRLLEESALVACQRADVITMTTIAVAGVTLLASLFAVDSGFGVVSLVVIFAASQAAMVAVYLLCLHIWVCRICIRPSFAFFRQILQELKAFAGSSLLGGLMARPEILLLSVLRSEAHIGFYSAALRIVEFWGIIAETGMRNVLPVLANAAHIGDRRKVAFLVDRSMHYLLALSLPLAVGIAVSADLIVATLYGPGFQQSVPAVRLMALCIPVNFLLELLWRVLVARGEQHLMLRAQVITSVARVAGASLLIAWYGWSGAALSYAVFICTHFLLLLHYSRRDRDTLSMPRMAYRVSLAALSMGCVTAILSQRTGLWITVAGGTAAYLLTAVLFRVLLPEELALLRRIWQPRPSG